eukprot:3256831-Alexandrium_andersonii.AAC.1
MLPGQPSSRAPLPDPRRGSARQVRRRPDHRARSGQPGPARARPFRRAPVGWACAPARRSTVPRGRRSR